MAEPKTLYVQNDGRFETTFVYRIVSDNPDDPDSNGDTLAFVEFETPLGRTEIESLGEALRHAKRTLDPVTADVEDYIREALDFFGKSTGKMGAVCGQPYIASIGFDI